MKKILFALFTVILVHSAYGQRPYHDGTTEPWHFDLVPTNIECLGVSTYVQVSRLSIDINHFGTYAGFTWSLEYSTTISGDTTLHWYTLCSNSSQFPITDMTIPIDVALIALAGYVKTNVVYNGNPLNITFR